VEASIQADHFTGAMVSVTFGSHGRDEFGASLHGG
jgi:hypothetical protein